MTLDMTITSPQQRVKIVNEILQSMETQPKPSVLEQLSNYILNAINKQERKDKKILTDNRLVTINKRETSYQGLALKLQSGEDGIHALITANAKNLLLTPKIKITQRDVSEVPGLAQLEASIARTQSLLAAATGPRKRALRKQLIEQRQQQYILKNNFRQPVYCTNILSAFNDITFYDDIVFNQNGYPINRGPLSFFNPLHIEALLTNYASLKARCSQNITSDAWCIIQDFDALLASLTKSQPILGGIAAAKIRGDSNADIQSYLLNNFQVQYSPEYISHLWRNKIPKMLAAQAQRDYIIWHYTYEDAAHARWKTCSRCHTSKLAHPLFYNRNPSSSDGFYSICKDCRSKGGRR